MPPLLRRVPQRRLFQWLITYLAGAWLVLQVLDLLAGFFEWPTIVGRVATVLLGVGFLAALVLAWYHGERGEQKVTGVEIGMLAGILVIAGAAVAFVGGGKLEPAPELVAVHQIATTADRKTLAVLPFENRSAQADNAFFASGLHEEILTQLSKIGDLKVISRTSVETYEGTSKTLKQIGAELGAGVVVEGSVQRVDDRVRVQVQLIDAGTDQHLWAEKYDRQLTDVFAIQSDVAQQIAGALEARLTAGERERIERIPTKSMAAYGLYLQSRDYVWRRAAGPSGRVKAVTLLERAVALDPGFALAYAALSRLHTEMYWYGFDATDTRLAQARAAAERALELQPDLPEGHLALGHYHSYGFRDYDRALQEFSIALRSLPNNAGAIGAIGGIRRRQGRWREAIANYEKSVELDPRSIGVLWALAVSYEYTRDFPKAVATLTRMLALDPGRIDWEAQRAQMVWHGTGQLDSLRAVVARAERQGRPFRSAAFELAVLERRFADAARIMGEPLEAGAGLVQRVERALNLGVVYQALGQPGHARASFDSARVLLEASRHERTDQLPTRARLALAYAGLGRKDDALREARGALEEMPVSQDARGGPDVELLAAEVFARVGEADAAVAHLEHLLSIPSFVTGHTLRMEPRWDPLRGHPGFQRLLPSGS